MKLNELLNDCTVTGYRTAIYEKTGMINFEPKIYQEYELCGEEFLLGLNFELGSHKKADLMKIVFVVCRLVRYRKK